MKSMPNELRVEVVRSHDINPFSVPLLTLDTLVSWGHISILGDILHYITIDIPRALGIPGAGLAVVRTGAAGIGLVTVGIGFYNIGVFGSGLVYAAFPGSNGLPTGLSSCPCEGQ